MSAWRLHLLARRLRLRRWLEPSVRGVFERHNSSLSERDSLWLAKSEQLSLCVPQWCHHTRGERSGRGSARLPLRQGGLRTTVPPGQGVQAARARGRVRQQRRRCCSCSRMRRQLTRHCSSLCTALQMNG